jgi:Domain of unknown function (DUF4169)
MTGEVVNLRRVRKAKARSMAELDAAENRNRFGRSKSARTLEVASRELDERRLEAHRREARGLPERTDDR